MIDSVADEQAMAADAVRAASAVVAGEGGRSGPACVVPGRGVDAQAARICLAFGGLIRGLHQLDRPGWLDLDLTMSQLKSLMLLVETGGLSGRELAERLGIGAPAVTALVDRLVLRGYVRREDDPADRRVSWARPTESAVALFDRLHSAHHERLVEILSAVAPDELDVVERAVVALEAAAARRVAERRAVGNGC